MLKIISMSFPLELWLEIQILGYSYYTIPFHILRMETKPQNASETMVGISHTQQWRLYFSNLFKV
jgi:hypothetical protein